VSKGSKSVSLFAIVGIILLAGFATLPSARAQSLYGGIRGTVRDSTGEPVPGASVTAIAEEKGVQLRVKTDAQGRYSFPQLQPDSYDVRANAAGGSLTVTDNVVSADDESIVDLKLPAPGQTGLIQSTGTLRTRADVAITLDRNALVNLPNYDQNATRFGFLAPGTQLRGTSAISSQDPQNSLQLSIDGQVPAGTASQLDGTDNRDSINQLVVINPPLESLAEVRITTQSFDAETGQALSGVAAVQTRSGGNAWHGSALEFRRTSWAEASNPNLQNPSVESSPFFRVNLFGGSLGGPILKNTLFIFGDYQGTRRSLGSTQVFNVPSALVRSTCLNPQTISPCDLSEYLPFDISAPSTSPLVYDPTTKMPFQKIPGCGLAQGANSLGKPGYCIPHNRLSPQAMNLLSLLPPPNVPASASNDGGAVSNYQVSGAEAWDEDDYTTRVDENLTKRLQLFGRYTFADFHIHSPSAFGSDAGGTGFGPDMTASTSHSPNHSLSTGFDYALNPGLYTDFRFGFFRRQLSVLANSYDTTPATNAGILGVNLGTPLTSGMPAIIIGQPILQVTSSAIDFGDGQSVNQCNCPLMETLQQFQWVNNWVKTQGNHVVKWGEDFRLAEDRSLVSAVDRSGAFSFTLKDTASPTGIGGLGLATFLIGDVSSFSRNTGNTTDAASHQKRMFFYGQDIWRATSKLTLSYGLRWEVYFPETVTGKGQGGYLNLSTGMIGVAGYSCCNLAGNVQNDWRNLAPRVGIAYQLSNRTVVRVGYGRNFDSGVTFGRSATLNPPVVTTQALSQPSSAPYWAFQLGEPGTDPIPAIKPYTVSPSGEFPLPPNVVASAVPTRIRVPTLDQWNLAIQHELAPNLSFELAYVGNQATHVVTSGSSGAASSPNVNQPTIAGFAACKANPMQCLQRYPYAEFGWTQMITLSGGLATANYNALQTKIVKRFSKGFEFNANYTWSKGIGYQADYFDQDPRLNRGVNVFDRTHTFILYNVLDLPLGKGRAVFTDAGKITNYFVGGWSLNTVTTWASGLPFSPSYASTECTQDRDTGPCRPNIVSAVSIIGDRNNYFTTTGGQPFKTNGDTLGPWQRPAVGTFGDAGYNSLRGPAFFDTDLVVAKNISMTERYALQFRTDFVNVFNKVNLGLPSGCVDCAANGAQTGAIITSIAANATQRQIEFSLRLQF
jgi:hypothetical protein